MTRGRPSPVLALACAGLAAGCAPALQDVRQLGPRHCPSGFFATFVQLSARQLALDAEGWRDELTVMRSTGVRNVVLQYTGDERGLFDRHLAAAPVRTLLATAAEAGVTVLLGLFADPRWPLQFDLERGLPPPLGDAAATAELVALCAGSPACIGFYLSPELDDARWGGPSGAIRVAGFVARSARAIKEKAPGKLVAMAPFFTGQLPPAEHAAYWQPTLDLGLIDIFMLQDGVGTGRAEPEAAARYLGALRRIIRPGAPPELWAVLELFRQRHGPPRDEDPFEADPAGFSVIERSLQHEGLLADRMIAFSVPDYMDPRNGGRARQLYDAYVEWCDARLLPGGH